MKTIIKLLIAAAVLHATWKAGSSYLRYYNFKDEVQQTAQFGGARSNNDLHNRVLELAKQHQVPLLSENVDVRREENHTYIDATYHERIELLPNYFYPHDFKVNVNAFTLVPREVK